jgi:cyclophilin family peptidyl-prolyl cis-trans isomerase
LFEQWWPHLPTDESQPSPSHQRHHPEHTLVLRRSHRIPAGAPKSPNTSRSKKERGEELEHRIEWFGSAGGHIDYVANFIDLANTGFYDNLVWHRIVAGFVIQTGDPNTKNAVNSTRSTWGSGGSSTTIPLETSALLNDQGYVAMARSSSPNSASSQFYINLVDNPSLNGQYAVFGKVVSGMNVVNAIGALPVYTNSASFAYDQPINAQNALLISVTITNTLPA